MFLFGLRNKNDRCGFFWVISNAKWRGFFFHLQERTSQRPSVYSWISEEKTKLKKRRSKDFKNLANLRWISKQVLDAITVQGVATYTDAEEIIDEWDLQSNDQEQGEPWIHLIHDSILFLFDIFISTKSLEYLDTF